MSCPKRTPPRPQGVERNVVITSWEWGTEKTFLHDLISSDRRNPTVNAYGPLYGSSEYSSDNIPILDPKTHTVTFFKMSVLNDSVPESFGPPFHASALDKPFAPSPYWGMEKIWSQKANNHNGMFDRKGRVWFAANVRGDPNPAFCKKGSDHPSAQAFPIEMSQRQVSMLDPKTMKYTLVDTCFGTHHPQFGYDADDTVWFSGSGPVAGWLNTKVFDETGDAVKAQGWAPWVLDANGNGKVDEYTEPGKPAESGKDMRVAGSGPYAVMPHPTDGSIWYTFNVFAGTAGFIRFDPKTKLSELYALPAGFVGLRGGDIDRNGVVWGSGSNGGFISFDRRKCKGPLNGPSATGNHCPEGFAYHRFPGPGHEGFEQNSAEASYYTWVDQHNTAGPRREHPDRHRQPERRLHRAQGREDGHADDSVPDGLLRQGAGRAHRRPERRLEGTRPVEHERRSHALADGRRQGFEAPRRAHPDPARSARAVAGHSTESRVGLPHAVVVRQVASCAARHDAAVLKHVGVLRRFDRDGDDLLDPEGTRARCIGIR